MAVQVNWGWQPLPDSTGFIFLETTGPYSAENLTGWGSPNTAWSTAYYAEITIKDSTGTVIGVTDTEFSFAGFDSTPSSTVWSTPKMTINASSYALTTFVDGVYDITYTARETSSGTVISSFEKYVLFDSQVQTNLLQAEIQYPTCNCGKEVFATRLNHYRSLLLGCQLMVQAQTYTTPQAVMEQLLTNTANLCLPC